jgi:hypothetical protein
MKIVKQGNSELAVMQEAKEVIDVKDDSSKYLWLIACSPLIAFFIGSFLSFGEYSLIKLMVFLTYVFAVGLFYVLDTISSARNNVFSKPLLFVLFFVPAYFVYRNKFSTQSKWQIGLFVFGFLIMFMLFISSDPEL